MSSSLIIVALSLIGPSVKDAGVEVEPWKVYGVFTVSHYGKGDGFDGKQMANRKIMDKDDPTIIAHKSLPLGTKVRFTNNQGIKLVGIIQDRGPYVDGVEFDISFAAAQKLGITKDGKAILKTEIPR